MAGIKQRIMQYLHSLQKVTVWTEELERVIKGEQVTYAEFADVVIKIEESGLLEAIKSTGRNPKPPHVAYRYRIQVSLLRSDFQKRLHQHILDLHPLISLDRYYSLGESTFEYDLPYIRKVHHYLQINGIPKTMATAPERSFSIVEDEKWITEGNGKSLLERIGLFDLLKIDLSPEPLMFAVRPQQYASTLFLEPYKHLIVENKTTFLALLPVLSETIFHTLIYGCGNKIVGNIDMFEKQYPVAGHQQQFYYFGDLDHAGIQIWYSLNRRMPVIPALPFYRACLDKTAVLGKTNQRRNETALNAFSAYFEVQESHLIRKFLSTGYYYPQEILSAEQLQTIWKESTWKLWKTPI